MEAQTADEEQEIKAGLAEILAQCEPDRSQLIPILQKVQESFGYLPKLAISEIGSHLGMTDVQIYGVASFYNHLQTLSGSR